MFCSAVGNEKFVSTRIPDQGVARMTLLNVEMRKVMETVKKKYSQEKFLLFVTLTGKVKVVICWGLKI
jgi:hypothetical protein